MRHEARLSLTPEGRARAQRIAQALGIRSHAGWLVVTVMVLNRELDRMQDAAEDDVRELAREMGVLDGAEDHE